ncbi:MAG: hypothetical protein SO253_02300 [Bacilli bacterium]|nr:hypothetical protein [Bacilli bacterium]
MSNTLTKQKARKYLQKLNHFKRNYVSFEMLEDSIGIVKDVLKEDFANFDPMIRMYDDVNLMDYVSDLNDFINAKKEVKKKAVRLQKYNSVSEFIYQNCTTSGGIIDVNFTLSPTKLKELRKVVNKELKELKEKGYKA